MTIGLGSRGSGAETTSENVIRELTNYRLIVSTAIDSQLCSSNPILWEAVAVVYNASGINYVLSVNQSINLGQSMHQSIIRRMLILVQLQS